MTCLGEVSVHYFFIKFLSLIYFFLCAKTFRAESFHCMFGVLKEWYLLFPMVIDCIVRWFSLFVFYKLNEEFAGKLCWDKQSHYCHTTFLYYLLKNTHREKQPSNKTPGSTKVPFFTIGSCFRFSFHVVLTLVSDRAVLYGNVPCSILVLSPKKRCFSFLEKGIPF